MEAPHSRLAEPRTTLTPAAAPYNGDRDAARRLLTPSGSAVRFSRQPIRAEAPHCTFGFELSVWNQH